MSPQPTLVFFCALLLMLVNSGVQASKGIFNVNIQLTRNPTLTTQDISAIGSGVCAAQTVSTGARPTNVGVTCLTGQIASFGSYSQQTFFSSAIPFRLPGASSSPSNLRAATMTSDLSGKAASQIASRPISRNISQHDGIFELLITF